MRTRSTSRGASFPNAPALRLRMPAAISTFLALLFFVSSAHAASFALANRVDSPGSVTWDVQISVFNDLYAFSAELTATGPGVVDVQGTEMIYAAIGITSTSADLGLSYRFSGEGPFPIFVVNGITIGTLTVVYTGTGPINIGPVPGSVSYQWFPGAYLNDTTAPILDTIVLPDPPQVVTTSAIPVEYSNDIDEQGLAAGGHGAPEAGQVLYTEPIDMSAPTDFHPKNAKDLTPGATGGSDPLKQVDALAYGNDAFFDDLIIDTVPLLVSVKGDAGAHEVALFRESALGVLGIAYTQGDFFLGDDGTGVEDVDAVELWGEAGVADACYFSFAQDVTSGTSVYRLEGTSTVPFLSHPDIYSAVSALGYTGDADFVDVDALMVKNAGEVHELEPGDAIVFSIRGVPGSGFNGGEIIVLPAVDPPYFLSHGGHIWGPAFDVAGAVADLLGESDPIPGSEDVDAIEAGEVLSIGVGPAMRENDSVTLYPAIPNPFNPSTTIGFEVRAQAQVTLAIYDVRGRVVAVLVNGVMSAGPHRVTWDGRGSDGASLSSGVYFARIEALGATQTRKLVLMK